MADEMNKEQIAILPEPHNDEHEYCSICFDDNITLVIKGGSIERGTNCHYCGNTIVLCSKHAFQMQREMQGLDF